MLHAFQEHKGTPPTPNFPRFSGKFGVQLDVEAARRKFDAQLLSANRLRRLTDYLAVAMIYLQDNFLLQQPLAPEHIKERLLGHWGTCPGLNLIYAHCNLLIKRHKLDSFIIVGPGHGAPSLLANLWAERSLGAVYEQYGTNKAGMEKLIKRFSWPNGFPSHANPQLPGCIHEGGELGYALSVAFGAVLDNPELVLPVVVGDGEAETGPTATAWHLYKYLDPKESGAVLPILHRNGWKISSPTIMGAMTEEELNSLFTGYGYEVRFCGEHEDLDADVTASLEWALGQIRKIQIAARNGIPMTRPKWPMIVLSTPKGMGAPETVKGQKIAGSYRSHQVPIRQARDDEEELRALELWLKSYKVNELLDEEGAPATTLDLAIPNRELSMGWNKHTRAGVKDLVLPNSYALEQASERAGGQTASIAESCGKFFAELVKLNPSSFRVFSPDELESNHMQAILDATTRNFQWNDATANRGGRVLEILSEHCCQGWMQGYTLTGRWSAFPSYETFLGIVTTMMIQYAKFLKISKETPWRQPFPGALYVESSTLWRQEHNGYSHQDPMFLSNLLNMKHDLIHVYLPPDANSVLACLEQCFTSKNALNLIVCTKAPMPSYLTLDEARLHVKAGYSVVPWLSTDEGREPDIILAGCGNETSVEVAEAAKLLRRDLPQLRVRVVNIVDVTMLDLVRTQQRGLCDKFVEVFSSDKPVIINWHGYPSAIRQLLFSRAFETHREILVLGYREEGTTTTPFKMLTLNHVDRFSVACEAIRISQVKAPELQTFYQSMLAAHDEFIVAYGKDPEWLSDIPRFKPRAVQAQMERKASEANEKASNVA